MTDAVKYALLYPAEGLVLLTTLALLTRLPVPRPWGWFVGGLAVLAWVVRSCVFYPEGFDLVLFWEAGARVLRGEDPYLADVRLLNPPVSLPLYAALALVPFSTALGLYVAANVLGGIALVPLSREVLAWDPDQAESPSFLANFPPAHLAVLTGVVAFCYADRRGLDAGQLSLLVILVLLAGLAFQGRGRPVLAGGCLAVAAVKIAILLPFLLLFLRKRDLPAWAALAVTGVGLTLVATPPGEVLPRCRECLANIATLSQPGRVNDFLPVNTQSLDLITLDHAFYHLGVRDRGALRLLHLGTLALLGGGLALAAWRGLGRQALCSLLALYALVFLYHRQYDTLLLALPLVYVTARARSALGRVWGLYALSGGAILGTLYIRLPELEALRVRSLEGRVSPLLEAVAMPYCTWLVLAAFLCLALAEWLASTGKEPMP